MKKLLVFIICLEFISLPANSAIIDEFAEKTLDKNLKILTPVNIYIHDDFTEKTLDKSLRIKKQEYKYISDDFAEQNQNKNISTIKKVDYQEFFPTINSKSTTRKFVVIDQSSMTSVPVRIKKEFTTKEKIEEGDFIDFETIQEVKVNKKSYPAQTLVKARVETISLNKMMGVPSDLIIGSFSMDGIYLAGEINKTGANRSLWVYPCTYGLSWFFGVGLLFIPIRGGHAKIKTSEIYTLYAK